MSASFDKTIVSFNKGVNEGGRQVVVQVLGVKEVDVHDHYLGLPIVIT